MPTKMSEIVDVLQHDSVAGEIIAALMGEIEDLENKLSVSEDELEAARWRSKQNEIEMREVIAKLDEQADFKASMELALSAALDPYYIAEIAAEHNNKIVAIKTFRDHARYTDTATFNQNQIGLKDAKEFIEAIWRVRDEARQREIEYMRSLQ